MPDLRSIHVPASVVQRVYRVLQWLSALLLPVVTAAVISTWQWIVGRVDAEYVASRVQPALTAAAAAEAHAHTAATLSKAHDPELVLVWRELILLHAELLVQRRYAKQDAAVRSEWIEQARRDYAAAYDTDRENRPNDPPSRAAARVLRAEWRPDR